VTDAADTVVLTELTAADIDAVVEIERRSFDRPWSRTLFLRELESDISRTILAREGKERGAVLGYVCRWLIVDEVQILNLAVHPDRRRRGIGRLLMQRVLDEAAENKVRTMTLEVRDGNEAAMRLYEGLGFERAGVRRAYYGQGRDGVLMTRAFDVSSGERT
jgi:ribosomal-protein-alanine N-acetyltransferase